jgi:hypothetical protein
VLSLLPRQSASPRSVRCADPCCLRPPVEGSASGSPFRGLFSRSLPLPPNGSPSFDYVERFQGFRFLPPRYPGYEVLTLASVRLSPTEHTSLLLDTQPDVRISRIRLSDRFHRQAHGAAAKGPCSRSTPRRPKIAASPRRRVPRVGTFCLRLRKWRTRSARSGISLEARASRLPRGRS